MAMQIVLTNSTGGSNFFDFGFDGTLQPLTATSTLIVLRNAATGAISTISGTGFTFGPGGSVTGGTVSGWITQTSGGQVVATISGIAWSATDYQAAVIAVGSGNRTPLDLLLSSQPITLDASAYGEPVRGLETSGITSAITALGSHFGDHLQGGAGNDTINPGGANMGDDGDTILSSTGTDRYVFTGITTDDAWLDLVYSNRSSGISATINGVANTGLITGTGLSHTLIDVTRPLNDDGGGFSVFGSTHADTFNITTAAAQWMAVYGDEGVDTYNIRSDGVVMIDFSGGWDDWRGADAGAVVNLATGAVANDGYGNAETITFLGGTGQIHVTGTLLADHLTGSARSDSFVGLAGSDTIDGGAGFDRIHYGRREHDAGVNVNLGTGIATGSFDGTAFTHRLTSIENVRGSALNDTIIGGAADENLDGRDGSDMLAGQGGNDWLRGLQGDDTAYGGTGEDHFVVGANQAAATVTFEILGGYAWLHIDTPGSSDLVRSDVELINFNDNQIEFGELAALARGGAITGNGAPNNLPGTAGSDIILGREDNDWITPGGGDDLVDGGEGVDMASYVDATARAVIDLAAGTAVIGTNTDFLISIENITGTIFSDLITGSAVANRIRALGDYDWLVGSGGGDTFEGGTGRDTVAYSAAPAAVIASLLTDTGTAGQAAGDVYIDIENLTGSSHNDRLTGDNDRNTLRGLAGDDFLFGLGGNDTFDGGAGRDSIDGGLGNDRMTGGRGNDTIGGGGGWDTALFSGNRAAYSVTVNANGSVTVVHTGGGIDGVDLLTGIEVLEFANGRLFL